MARSSVSSSTPNGQGMTNTPKGRHVNNVYTPSPSANLMQECSRCGSIFAVKDKNRHTDTFCAQVRTNAVDKLNHGFIKDGVMTSSVVNVSLKEKEVQSVPQNKRSHLLLMNEIAMDFMELKDGDPVKVILDKTMSLFAWRCKAAKNPCSVSSPALGNQEEEEQDTVCVEKITSSGRADFIAVTSSIPMVCLLEATIQVRRLLIGRYVFNGMVVKTCDSEELDENLSEIFTISTANSIDPLTSSMQSLSLSSPRFYEVTKETRVMVKSQTTAAKPFSIAGLEKEIEELEKFTVNSILNRHLLRDMKASPPRGIILYGFTGTGKTSVMSAFVNKHHGTSMSCYSVNSASLIGKNFEATEKKINEIITLTAETAPSIIFFDRIEVIASGRTKNQTNEEKRLIHCLMSHLEILHTHSPEKMVILVGITNSVEDIDSSLRGPNRFSIEIEFPIPLAKHREVILKNHLSNISHSIPESESSCLASTAFSFTGADLSLVVSRAAVNATNVGRNEVTTEDLRRAFASTKPSAMKEISLEVPCVKWSSIGGVSAIKSRLEQIVLWPFKHSSYLETMGISGHKGVLLYGPPGCSKTMIGKALATESKINFISIKGPEVFNKYVGESEKAVRDLFKKARQASPSIIFFDEIDALTMERGDSSHNVVSDRVLATLLTELDGVEGRDQVMIVAATNRPDKIDPAIKRPGRLDCQIYVSLPDNEARKEIFEIRMEKMPVDLDVDTEELSKRTEGYSGAEVTAVCTEAALNVIQRSLDENVPAAQSRVKMIDFEAALKTVKPRTDRKTIEFFEKYTERN